MRSQCLPIRSPAVSDNPVIQLCFVIVPPANNADDVRGVAVLLWISVDKHLSSSTHCCIVTNVMLALEIRVGGVDRTSDGPSSIYFCHHGMLTLGGTILCDLYNQHRRSWQTKAPQHKATHVCFLVLPRALSFRHCPAASVVTIPANHIRNAGFVLGFDEEILGLVRATRLVHDSMPVDVLE